MADNEELDPPPPQDIYNVFAAADLLSRSSYDSDQYKIAWLKVKVICSSILPTRECLDACSRALFIVPNHKEIAPIMVGDRRHLSKNNSNAITQHEQK